MYKFILVSLVLCTSLFVLSTPANATIFSGGLIGRIAQNRQIARDQRLLRAELARQRAIEKAILRQQARDRAFLDLEIDYYNRNIRSRNLRSFRLDINRSY